MKDNPFTLSAGVLVRKDRKWFGEFMVPGNISLREALELSIAKWTTLEKATGHTIGNGSISCALCAKFSGNNCVGCPMEPKCDDYGSLWKQWIEKSCPETARAMRLELERLLAEL